MVQALQDRGVLFGAAMRYRALGEQRWRPAEAVQFDGPELVFLCDVPYELNVDVEVLLPARVQVVGYDSPLVLLCRGQVTRRVLANWPELRSALVVNIAESRLAGDADYAGGAAVVPER